MKKNQAVILLLLIVGVSIILSSCKDMQVGVFSLDEYTEYMETFSSEEFLGSINTAEVAVEKAEMLWEKRYGKAIIEKVKPFKVCYDKLNEAWLVNGTFHKSILTSTKRGTAHIIIRKIDGRVLAVWHDK